MNNIVPQLQQQLTDSHNVVSRYRHDDLSLVRNELEQRFRERTPQVMLYGAYNAGKSTLVNALLGRDEAPMQDIPTTFQVDSYPWNGFCLLDTPGVNAPIAHEEATAEQVQKCGLMLFVIREGDQDVKALYQRLFKLIKRGKQVFIVLNCERSDPEAMAVVLARVNTIMAEMGPEYGVDDATISAIPVCPVNLASALSGRRKDSDKLLDLCGYTALVDRLQQWLASYNHETRQMATLRSAVNDLWFQPAWKSLNHKLGNQEESLVNRLQQSRAILERDKHLLEHSAFAVIQQQVNGKKGEVFGILDSADNSASVQSRLQTLFDEVAGQTEVWLNRELEDTASKITTVIEPVMDDFSPLIKEGSPMMDMVRQKAREELSSKKTLTELLKYGKKLKIPGLKGRWQKTLNGWGGKAAGVFQVAFAAYDVYSAGKQQDEENRAQRERAISLGQCVETLCANVHQGIYHTVQTGVNDTFDQRIAEVDGEINELINQQGELQRDHACLARAISELT